MKKEDKRKLVISSYMGNSYVVSVFGKEKHSVHWSFKVCFKGGKNTQEVKEVIYK